MSERLVIFLRSRLKPRTDPETTQARWTRITEILDGAAKRPDPGERTRYLRRACLGDRALRREVEDLLRFEDTESGILGGPVLPRRQGPEERRPEDALRHGDEIGPYRVERLLGDGGMGVVVLVSDPTLDRRVALKLIRREKISDELVRRFHGERRILARLDHPGIARIFDGGTVPSGRFQGSPYFTMEHVEGEPIDLFCDRRRLAVGDRLRLVLKVCDALAAAHRNLVAHRDLKPSNVLVTPTGEPKLLDFGIAKELPDTSDENSSTHTGHLPLTLAYASPEQVRGRALTTATDVYSVGTLLYRLLCGHPPYLLDSDAFENARRICEDEPPPPSGQAVLAREEWRDGAPVVVPPEVLAHRRRSDTHELRRRLRGDLDAIVHKALAKGPDERYRSIGELAEDLRRHLEGLPVLARRATPLYRTAKFLRRHRWRLAIVALAAALLTASLTANRRSRRIAELEREQQRTAEQARQAGEQADALTELFDDLLTSADPDRSGGRSLTVREVLARSEERVRESLRDHPELLAHQLEGIGLTYFKLGHFEDALASLGESLRLRRSVYGRGDHPLVARGLSNLATAAYRTDDEDRSVQLYRLALAMKHRLGQEPVDLAKAESGLAAILTTRGEYAEAEERYRRILDLRLQAYGWDHPEVATTLRKLGNLLYLRSDFDAAEPFLRQALELRRKAYGSKHTAVALVLSSLGRVLHAQGRLEEADEILSEALAVRRELLGEGHLHVALTRKDLASLYFDLGEDATAAVLWSQSLAVLRARKPPGSWEIADAESQLGARLLARDRLAEAEPCLVESYKTLLRLRGEDAVYTRRAWERLKKLYRVQGKPLDEAVRHPADSASSWAR